MPQRGETTSRDLGLKARGSVASSGSRLEPFAQRLVSGLKVRALSASRREQTAARCWLSLHQHAVFCTMRCTQAVCIAGVTAPITSAHWSCWLYPPPPAPRLWALGSGRMRPRLMYILHRNGRALTSGHRCLSRLEWRQTADPSTSWTAAGF